MPSSLLTRLQRKDVLFQAFSDLVRHNGPSTNQHHNTRYRHRPLTIMEQSIRSAHCSLVSSAKSFSGDAWQRFRLLPGGMSPCLLDHCQALSTDVNATTTTTTSDSTTDSNELIEFKQLSAPDKKVIAKRLGLKTAFLEEINLQTSNDLSTLHFAYCYFDGDVGDDKTSNHVLKTCMVRYDDFNMLRLNGYSRSTCYRKESLPQLGLDFVFYPVTHSNQRQWWLSSDGEEVKPEEAVVVVESALDALAVAQQTNLPTVVLRLIASDHWATAAHFKHFSDKLNSHFKKIYFWSNDDEHCERFRTLCLKNFDTSKLFMVYNHLAPLQMLHRGGKEKIGSVLGAAVCTNHPSIVTFGDLKDDIFKELTDFTVNGVQWTRFPKFNEHFKGHRNGELTIVTGPTGSGKTTFVSEYSLDLCMQGVSTLWGSFEIKNVRLAKMMLTQFARKNLISCQRDEFEEHSGKFAKLPLYFMRFHGQTDVDLVLQAARHSVSTLGVRHIVLDNLQFLLGLSVDSNFDRFLKQDYLIAALRQFSTEHNCHITLVAHPRKEKEEMALSNNSLYGGIKASQEADNVMIIVPKFHSRFRCNKYVQITKNRYNGALGVVPLYFDKNTLCFSSTMQPQQAEMRAMTTDDYHQNDSASHISKKEVKDVPDLCEIRYLYTNQ